MKDKKKARRAPGRRHRHSRKNTKTPMSSLRISLRHADLLKVPSSIVFMKHIEGVLSTPESALNAAIKGRLKALLAQCELEGHVVVDLDAPRGPNRVYIVNFDATHLPFSYQSVDKYARTILRIGGTQQAGAAKMPVTIATAIHGPGAGLDACEAMETLVRAFSSELGSGRQLGLLSEVILVEKQKEVFERLQERFSYLAAKKVLSFDDSICFINPGTAQTTVAVDARRVEQLSSKHLFVAMPFAKEFNNVYYFGIKQPVELRRRKCERVDQDAFTGDIIDRIKKRIDLCELVIADITGNNPNVFFEVGYAQGRRKTVILLSQTEDTPFDLKTQRQIRYDPQDLSSLVNAISKQLDDSLSGA
jgi:hypothetical protein